MVIIDENGMSSKLVEFCKENKTFRKNFISLFTDRTDILDIDFTGNTETGYGKPDITITFANNFYFYIEVKTRISTGFQENQINSKYGYSRLIKENNQVLESSLGYLLDNNHDTTQCLTRNIVLWQNILELVEDFNNTALVKDIKQNVDGIVCNEKLFGPDEELFSNPYQLSVFNDFVVERNAGEHAANNWIFNNFLVPALISLGYSDAECLPWNEDGYYSSYVRFKRKKQEIHITYNSTMIWNNNCSDANWIGSYYFNSFTFYRPWILGVRTSTNEKQLQDFTAKAIVLWLYDLDQNFINKECNSFDDAEEDFYSVGYLGTKAELYGNPLVFANCIEFLHNGEEIYDEIVIPALKILSDVKIKNRNYFDDYRYIEIEYKNTIIKFNIFQFWSSKTQSWTDYHAFTFYRPWIVGVHKSKTKDELRDYTRQSLLLWFKDLMDEGKI